MNKKKAGTILLSILLAVGGSAGIVSAVRITSQKPVMVIPAMDARGWGGGLGMGADLSGYVTGEGIQNIYISDATQIKSINVKEGQKVTKGQTLMTYDQTQTGIALKKEQLAKKNVELKIRIAKQNLNTLSHLSPNNGGGDIGIGDIELPGDEELEEWEGNVELQADAEGNSILNERSRGYFYSDYEVHGEPGGETNPEVFLCGNNPEDIDTIIDVTFLKMMKNQAERRKEAGDYFFTLETRKDNLITGEVQKTWTFKASSITDGLIAQVLAASVEKPLRISDLKELAVQTQDLKDYLELKEIPVSPEDDHPSSENPDTDPKAVTRIQGELGELWNGRALKDGIKAAELLSVDQQIHQLPDAEAKNKLKEKMSSAWKAFAKELAAQIWTGSAPASGITKDDIDRVTAEARQIPAAEKEAREQIDLAIGQASAALPGSNPPDNSENTGSSGTSSGSTSNRTTGHFLELTRVVSHGNGQKTFFQDSREGVLTAQSASGHAEESEDSGESETPDLTGSELVSPSQMMSSEEIRDAKKNEQEKLADLELDLREEEIKIKNAQKKFDEGIAVANFDGIVKTVKDKDHMPGAGEPFLSLTSVGGQFMKFAIPESAYTKVNVGDHVTAMSYTSGEAAEAEITEISLYPDSSGRFSYGYGMGGGTTMYPVYARFTEETKFNTQDSLQVTLLPSGAPGGDMGEGDGSDEAFYLQEAFIRTDEGEPYVYLRNKSGKLEKRIIQTGKYSEDAYEILSGVTEEDYLAFPYGKNVRQGARTVEGSIQDLYTQG